MALGRDKLFQVLQVVACSLTSRSFNDLTQYSIFSLVVAKQTSTTLKLDTEDTFSQLVRAFDSEKK